MSFRKFRGPRTLIPKVCANRECLKPDRKFTGFRKTAKFCSDECRKRYHRKSTIRQAVLRRHGSYCDVCGDTESQRFFVWEVKGHERDPDGCKVLCGRCHYTSLSTPESRARREKWIKAKGLEGLIAS